MNCRNTSSLLSAYIDRELTGAQMLEIRDHLEHCASCQAELEGLQETKSLLSSLALRAPRAELEQLLVVRAERVAKPSLLERILPPEWSDAMLWRWEGVGNLNSPRLRPLAATAVLSLAGLCLATASVSRPSDEAASGELPHAFAVYVGPTTLVRVPMQTPTVDTMTRYSAAGVGMVSFPPTENGGAMLGGYGTAAQPPVQSWGEDDFVLPAGAAARYNTPHHYDYTIPVYMVSASHR